jgi:signal transduction histidine kinase
MREDLSRFERHAAFGLGAVLLTMITLVIAAVMALRAAGAEQERALTQEGQTLLNASRVDLAAEEVVSAAQGFFLTNGSARLSDALSIAESFDHELDALLANAHSPEEREHLGRARRAADEYRRAFTRLIAADDLRPGGRNASAQRLAPLFVARDALKAQTATLSAYANLEARQMSAKARRARERAAGLILGLGAIGTTLALALARFTAKRLGRLFASEQQATRQATLASVARDQVLAVVAHDLRSPLSAIMMQAALIRRGPPDRIPQHTRAIEDISMRMEALIRNLLDAAAIEGGGFSVRPERTLVGPLVASTLELFGPLAQRKSIRLEHEVRPAELEALCDRDRTANALGNLIANAVDFTEEGGSVKVAAYGKGRRVFLEVKDSGPGIRPEHLRRVFERFWKAETGGRKGAGLGLFIARAIVEAQGGRIWVESAPGKGATFICELAAWGSGEAQMTASERPPAFARPVRAS